MNRQVGQAALALMRAPSPALLFFIAAMLGVTIRLWFSCSAVVINPMVGDAAQYCDYAWNLLHFHTFSMAQPGSDAISPDAFRDPGYPLLLSVLLWFLGSGDTWYHAVLMVQAVLGGLSAGLVVLVCLRWLPSSAAFSVGLGAAVWPHSVAIAGYLLSESLFTFLLLLAFWLLAIAAESDKAPRWALAGLGFGVAAMVNATLTPFCMLLGVVLWGRTAVPKRLLIWLVAASLVLPCAWGVRGRMLQTQDSASSRAIANLVQGSWPEYHAAFLSAEMKDPQGVELLATIFTEIETAWHSPREWLPMAERRMAAAPAHYLAWYAWKPALLWAWDIRVGWGDIYMYPTSHSIYRTYPSMRWLESLCFVINPLLFIGMTAATFQTLLRPRSARSNYVLLAVALAIAYETCIYSLLQSEPRYSIPLRPLQMMLVATFCLWIRRRAIECRKRCA